MSKRKFTDDSFYLYYPISEDFKHVKTETNFSIQLANTNQILSLPPHNWYSNDLKFKKPYNRLHERKEIQKARGMG